MLERIINKIWYKKEYFFLSIILLPLSLIYYIFWKIADLYYNFLHKPKKLNCPVISVGNISLGGTGKTPFIIFLIQYFLNKGIKDLTILTRGYKGKKLGVIEDKEGEPDEARLLKKLFPEIVVLANPKRHEAFLNYYSNKKLPQIVILDDGFQHRRLFRDLDILMIDGYLNFGNGYLFPAGPLREPRKSMKRADIIIIKRLDGEDKLIFEKPMFYFNIQDVIIKNKEDIKISKELLKNKKITAFCGIANPEGFKKTIIMTELSIENFFAFPDHYNYTKKDIDTLLGTDCDAYITTQKDWVKVSYLWPEKKELYVLIPEFTINDRDGFERILNEKICFS
ncbi:MAG: tetraacyldisaccharide 4'-kinase [Proteobacteria bacterium]|nr:tetraacyldisaccharide 4'-kinase [Pseudomonadota bacterium]